MENKTKNKVSSYLSDKQMNYVRKQADDMGISISSFINVCISNYQRENDVLQALNILQEQIKKGVVKND